MRTFPKYIAIALIAVMFAACHKDDDNTPKPSPDQEPVVEYDDFDQMSDEDQYISRCQAAVICILQNLTDVKVIDSTFATNTYEPVYGTVLDGSSEMVRTKFFDTEEEAEDDFRRLVGLSSESLITTTPDGLAVSIKDIKMKNGQTLALGTLMYHRGGAETLGYIDVDIPCVPHLERIEYKTVAAIGANASGNSPYLKGDIVRCTSNYCKGFYLCVSQYDGRDGTLVHLCINEKGGDETINLDNDGDGCWYPYNEDHGHKTEFTDIKAYIDFIVNNQDKVKAIKNYLNGNLVQQPYSNEKMWHIFPEGFCNDYGVAFHSSDGRAAAIRYHARFGSYAVIPAYYYRISHYVRVPNDCRDAYNVSDKEYEYVRDSKWNSHFGEMWNYTMNVIHFGPNAVAGVSLEFSPTKDAGYGAHKNDAINATKAHLGWYYCDDDRLYQYQTDAKAAGVNILGVVAYVNDGSDFGDRVTEGYGHGLVMALNDAADNAHWNPEYDIEPDQNGDFTQFVQTTAAALTDFDGIVKTQYLKDEGSAAAKAALDYTPKPSKRTSGWFLPTTAQWLAMLCTPGLGGVKMPDNSSDFPACLGSDASTAIDRHNANSGLVKLSKIYLYWTSSAWSGKIGVRFRVSEGGFNHFSNKNGKGQVRPVFAF